MTRILERKSEHSDQYVNNKTNADSLHKTVTIHYFRDLENIIFGANTKFMFTYQLNKCSFFADKTRICEIELPNDKNVNIKATIAIYFAKLLMEINDIGEIVVMDKELDPDSDF
jgi:hypothetical protein